MSAATLVSLGPNIVARHKARESASKGIFSRTARQLTGGPLEESLPIVDVQNSRFKGQ
jgi:hypothetical protein